MSGVGTFIFGRPRPLSAHRRAGPPRDVRYTLIWEEPQNLLKTLFKMVLSVLGLG